MHNRKVESEKWKIESCGVGYADWFIDLRKPPAGLVVSKSFRYAQSHRRVKPPLCKGRCPVRTLGGGVVLIVTIPQSACSADSSLKVNWP